MDTPKISKLLRLMKLLTGNVSRTIDSLAGEGAAGGGISAGGEGFEA